MILISFHLTFHFFTDANNVGLSAVLSQEIGLGSQKVIAFAGPTLNLAERSYSTTEQKCLAVVWALEKRCCYLEVRMFSAVTDHFSTVWVLKTLIPNT